MNEKKDMIIPNFIDLWYDFKEFLIKKSNNIHGIYYKLKNKMDEMEEDSKYKEKIGEYSE